MKLAFSLVAVANAQPPNPRQIFEKAYGEVVDYVHENWGTFQAFVDGLNDSNFEPLWDFCHDELELEYYDEVGLDHESFVGCAEAFGHMFGDAHITFPYWDTFFDVLWTKADWDQSGQVVWGEWRYAEAVLAGVYSKVTFDMSDENDDQVMEYGEMSKHFSRADREAFHNLWKQSQLNGTDSTQGDMREIALFWMNYWNMLIDGLE